MTDIVVGTKELETITPRQLRQILFYLQDQNMTIKELRELLYDASEQDRPYNIDQAMFYRMVYSGRLKTAR